VALNFLFVDTAAMQIILNPKQFDVILTENLFGDIYQMKQAQ
jgi:3-isopropylmalate dehydrogenase